MSTTLSSTAPPLPTAKPRAVVLAMCACVLVTQSLVAAINLAIPKLSASGLHPSSAQLLWIVDAYVIVFAGLLIPAGALGDRFGRKGALLSGLAVFTAGAAGCALAPNVPVLLAARAVCGLGAALVLPGTMALLLYAVPLERRGAAVASWSSAIAVGGVLGNAGGALMLQYLPWQGLFWMYVPLGTALLAFSARSAPRVPRHDTALDLPGSGLLILGCVALLYGIIEGPALGWGSAATLGAFALATALLAVFVRHELRVAAPLLDPRLFRLPRVRAGALGVAAAFFGMFALFYVNAQFLQYVKGFSALRAGFAVLPLAFGMMVVTQRSMRWAARIGTAATVAAGLVSIAGGLLLLSTADSSTPYPLYACYMLLLAFGAGTAMPSLSHAIVTSLPQRQAGVGSALNTAARELGTALGVAAVGTALSTGFASRLPASLAGHADSTAATFAAASRLGAGAHTEAVAAFTHAVADGYRIAAALLLVLTVPVVAGLRRRPATQVGEPAL
ncbi:MFS transporter [Streptantibioticus ferralitis]|uniref:MFS transporter n=1 Tax=Streptantibioticus ferralitis TaxID=236510 RepID=A0ABT5Z803_9ACTN|nr:MFS transporter [Streptantibioticus ferralitis]MDF2259185.1 MFS transporter [Streptantibioticus ferralitis]